VQYLFPPGVQFKATHELEYKYLKDGWLDHTIKIVEALPIFDGTNDI
jgi:hypothetical protein